MATRCSPRRRASWATPVPAPSANLSQAYTNPLGRAHGPVHLLRLLRAVRLRQLFQGQPADHVLPVLMRKPNFEARTECEVTQDQPRPPGKRATGVTYRRCQRRGMGAAGRLVHALRLRAVQCAADAAVRHRQALRSATPTPAWSAATYATRPTSSVNGFFDDKISTSIPSSPPARSACASTISTATISTTVRSVSSAAAIWVTVQTNGRPIETTPVPPGTPRWGAVEEGGRATTISAL